MKFERKTIAAHNGSPTYSARVTVMLFRRLQICKGRSLYFICLKFFSNSWDFELDDLHDTVYCHIAVNAALTTVVKATFRS